MIVMYLFQMKKANFDVSHELDEFLMVEKPLTHTKRKQHPDLEKMRPELRQLEEQGLIARRSGRVTVLDDAGLMRVAHHNDRMAQVDLSWLRVPAAS